MGYKNNRVGYQKELLTSRAVIKKTITPLFPMMVWCKMQYLVLKMSIFPF